MGQFKVFIYGVLPYYWSKVFCPKSLNMENYNYIRKYGYSRHLYLFRHEYDNFHVDVLLDSSNGLHYVLHEEKRLYFHRKFDVNKISRMYKALVMEQDIRSAHHYFDSLSEIEGKTFLDIGSAEGFTSLEVVELVDKIYLFECDENWIEALNATFAPWKEKVCIINKYINDLNDERNQTLDDFLQDKFNDKLFLKMDIEGAERRALAGATSLFINATSLEYAICSYHLADDEKVIASFLDKYNCSYRIQRGYFNKKKKAVVFRSI